MNIFKKYNLKLSKNKGLALVESLFYISIFVILTLIVVNALVTMSRSFREAAINRDFIESSNIMERISRDIRESTGVLATGQSGDSLKLNFKDSGGSSYPIDFVLVGSDIQRLENNVFIGNLNSSHISVTSLNFTLISTAVGEAVKVSVTLSSPRAGSNRTESFYDTVVLRQAYGI